MKLKNKISAIATAVLLYTGAQSGAHAGAKLVIDDDTFINIGAGIRTAFTAVEDGSPNGESYSTDFDIQNSRIYVSGQLNEKFKFTFNTDEIFGEYSVLDAIIQYEHSAAFNIWAGRMLTPADRIEMNGPFYGLTWNQYTVPLFPSDAGANDEAGQFGRDNGVTVWGTIGKFQYAVGVFDGFNGASNPDDNLLFSGRFAYNFLNSESNPGYYTSSTYFGKAGDIFTVGLAFQSQADSYGPVGSEGVDGPEQGEDFNAISIDFLSETVLDSGDVLTFEGEYKYFDCDCAGGEFTLFDGNSYFLTAAYMHGKKIGLGYIQPYVRYTSNEPDTGPDSDLTEVGVNYIIDGHNLRLNANVTDGDANLSGNQGVDTTTFTFGIQFQI